MTIAKQIEECRDRIREINLELEDEMTVGFYRITLYDMRKAEYVKLAELSKRQDDGI